MPRIPKKSYQDWCEEIEQYGYKSFLTNANFSSIATATEFYSIKNQRWCFAASPLEDKLFHYLEFKDNVAGYKEQFAIDPEISLSVAKRLNLRHHNAGKEPAVVTLGACRT